MNQAGSDIALTAWRAPECPFTIEYSQRVFDDIRLAIIDAFCSLPRGGAEIGGLLMGEWRPGCLRITAHAPLDCEHAHGPSFTLSANDESRLRELIAKSPSDFPGMVPVGWYHSHTRSEIFLSDADLSIHDRFFTETWQIALVLRPHMMQPTRAGFFFREASGDIHASEPYEEFSIEAKPMRPMPAGSLVEMPRPESEPHLLRLERHPANEAVAEARQITLFPSPEPAREEPAAVVEMPAEPVAQAVVLAEPPPAPVEALPVAALPAVVVPPEFTLMPQAIVEIPVARVRENEPVPADVQIAPPNFLSVQEAPSRNWMAVITIAFVLVAMGTIGYVTQRAWLPKVTAAARPAPAAVAPVAPVPPAPLLRLNAIEHESQLQISWDGDVPAVRNAAGATIEISDGQQRPQSITLDQAHLRGGVFTYARQNERVDMKLILHQPDGSRVSEVTTFLGKVPISHPVSEDPEAKKKSEEVAARETKLKADLERQAARTRKAENDLKNLREEMRQQQKRRMTNMIPTK